MSTEEYLLTDGETFKKQIKIPGEECDLIRLNVYQTRRRNLLLL